MINRELIRAQFIEVAYAYPDLMLHFDDEQGIIEGEFHFIATHGNEEIEDTYSIKIVIPLEYPEELPAIYEAAGRIPKSFHTFNNGTLCLEVDTKMKLDFIDNPTLIFYVQHFVLNYFFQYSYYEKHGTLPFGERSHDKKGILSLYMEIFNVDDYNVAFEFLKILANKKSRGYQDCPCGSGKKLKECHGPMVLKLKNLHMDQYFISNLKSVQRLIDMEVGLDRMRRMRL